MKNNRDRIAKARAQVAMDTVGAFQISADNFVGLSEWCDGGCLMLDSSGEPVPYVQLNTRDWREGEMRRGKLGDWVVEVDHEFRIYTNVQYQDYCSK
jgi:hypothetical protein